MTNLSQQFIEKSQEATSFDWDKDTYPDPSGIEDLFLWLDQNTDTFTNLPMEHRFSPGAKISRVVFTDGTRVSIRLNPTLDHVKVVDGDGEYPVSDPAQMSLTRESRAAYAYFAKVTERQNRRDRQDEHC